MDKREINRKPPRPVCKSREREREREREGARATEETRARREQRKRASEGYKHESLFPFPRKGRQKEIGEEGERSLASVHVGKGVCNAVESSGAKSQMEPTRAAVRRERRERVEEECYRIKWLCAHKHGFELATLFDVPPSLSLSLSLIRFPSLAIPRISICDWYHFFSKSHRGCRAALEKTPFKVNYRVTS